MQEIRTRIAPTPSGRLHLGNALSFVMTWALARAASGWVLLRIDDLDAARYRPEYLEDIFRTLDWLGLDYDAGPDGPTDFLKNYSQNLRLPIYQHALARLRQEGHLYACDCSRRQIRQISSNGQYPLTCRKRSLDWSTPDTAWRIRLNDSADSVVFCEWKQGRQVVNLINSMGDFVVRRKDGLPAYQIASLLDDQKWKINFIVRGADLRPSTAAQVYVAKLLDATTFQQVTFWHHGLIKDPAGNKLSKSKGAIALHQWRTSGRDPAPIFQQAAEWLGVPPKGISSARDLVERLRDLET